jgi:hypothetical protein
MLKKRFTNYYNNTTNHKTQTKQKTAKKNTCAHKTNQQQPKREHLVQYYLKLSNTRPVPLQSPKKKAIQNKLFHFANTNVDVL